MRRIRGALLGIAASAAALIATVVGAHVALIAFAFTVYPLIYPIVPRVSEGCADLSRADLHRLITARLKRWAQSRLEAYAVSDSSHLGTGRIKDDFTVKRR